MRVSVATSKVQDSWWASATPAPAPAPAKVQATPAQQFRARYDNAITTDDNARNWWSVDYLSAKAANSYQVRRTLRMRSRYELSNNPYLFGICNSNADDLISKGPTLQVTTKDEAFNKQVQDAWTEWWLEVGGVEKLRTCKLAKTVDGEGFLVLKTVRDMYNSVKLWPVDVEADQITTPAPASPAAYWVDGLTLHPVTGQPTSYSVLKYHPGDYYFPGQNPMKVDTVRAKHVIHWFPKFRPGQVRGVPVFTPALDLFTELRSFRKATVKKVNISAQITGVLETDGPADTETDDQGNIVVRTPYDHIPIEMGLLTTLANKQKLHQFDSGTPNAQYREFTYLCVGEACRPLAYPLNLALGTSQEFNFSSAKLDHINYRNSLDVERAQCETTVLEALFRAWFEEAVMVPKLLPRNVTLAEVPHEWHWPGYASLDPAVDIAADIEAINGGILTWQMFWAKRGYDWKDVFAQQIVERDEMEKAGLVFGEPLKKQERIDVIDPDADPADSKPAQKKAAA